MHSVQAMPEDMNECIWHVASVMTSNMAADICTLHLTNLSVGPSITDDLHSSKFLFVHAQQLSKCDCDSGCNGFLIVAAFKQDS